MSYVKTSPAGLFQQVLEPASHPNPYPIYEQLRKTPVAQLDENYYIVSSYNEIFSLLHDPRVGKEQSKARSQVQRPAQNCETMDTLS